MGFFHFGGGGGTTNPTPPDTSVQFNDGGVFGGDAGLTWGKTDKRFTAGTAITGLNADVANTFGSPTILLSSKNNVDPNFGVPNLVIAQSDGSDIGPSGTLVGTYSMALFTSTNNTGGFIAGSQIEGWTSSDSTKNVDELVGLAVGTLNGGTGTATQTTGLHVFSGSFGSSVSAGATKQIGIQLDSPSAPPGGASSTMYGIEIDNFSGAGTVSAGVHIVDQGTGAKDYAIKVDGWKSDFGPNACVMVVPTTDPHVLNALWNDGGTVKASLG